MRVFKDNEELKSCIFDGVIHINDSIECNFNINVEADITAWNIKSWNIKSGNINAWNIKAWNISYYAFCVAYNNIKCESIKGVRNNSFHKCLDGKLTIKEKLKEVTIKGQDFELTKEEINNLKKQLC